MREMIKRVIQAIKGDEDARRVKLVIDLMDEKTKRRVDVRNVTTKLQDQLQKAESWQRKYQGIKTEISHIRKRKTYYKKKCIFLEDFFARQKATNVVDSAE